MKPLFLLKLKISIYLLTSKEFN